MARSRRSILGTTRRVLPRQPCSVFFTPHLLSPTKSGRNGYGGAGADPPCSEFISFPTERAVTAFLLDYGTDVGRDYNSHLHADWAGQGDLFDFGKGAGPAELE